MSVLAECGSDPKPRHPWYKERLHKKYLKKSNHKLNLSGALNSHQWTFLSKGMDDFRDGYPSSSSTAFIPTTKGPAPILHNVTEKTDQSKKKSKKRFTKEQACFSKLLPLQQARREFIAEIEYGLTQHPLALYPHLEEGVPPNVFEEIVDILDPEMRVRSAAGSYDFIPEEQEDESFTTEKEQLEVQSVKSRDMSTRTSVMSEQSRTKNAYIWLSKVEEEPVKEDKNPKIKIKESLAPSLDGSVKQVTKEFCDWVTSLGGEQCNINESSIFSLFASGYDTKPVLSVPIHVVELNNVPAELRMSVGATDRQATSRNPHSVDRRQQYEAKEPTYCPSWVKTRYGAWYLDPKTWKKQKINEPLKDPKDEETNKNMDSRTRLSQKDEDLLQLHGAKAFKEFIEKKGYRKPEVSRAISWLLVPVLEYMMFLINLFSNKDTASSDRIITRDSRSASSARNMWLRSASASTHEDSIIN
ncbi:protein FAM47E-like [Rhinophrynus dorsalis]